MGQSIVGIAEFWLPSMYRRQREPGDDNGDRISDVHPRTGDLARGHVVWTPPADARRRFVLGRLPRLARGGAWTRLRRVSRPAPLVGHRPRGLLGFGLGLLRDWRQCAVRVRARLGPDAGSRMVPRRPAELPSAHGGRDEDTNAIAIVARPQALWPARLRLSRSPRTRPSTQRLGQGERTWLTSRLSCTAQAAFRAA
jgi:hypothetical protein